MALKKLYDNFEDSASSHELAVEEILKKTTRQFKLVKIKENIGEKNFINHYNLDEKSVDVIKAAFDNSIDWSNHNNIQTYHDLDNFFTSMLKDYCDFLDEDEIKYIIFLLSYPTLHLDIDNLSIIYFDNYICNMEYLNYDSRFAISSALYLIIWKLSYTFKLNITENKHFFMCFNRTRSPNNDKANIYYMRTEVLSDSEYTLISRDCTNDENDTISCIPTLDILKSMFVTSINNSMEKLDKDDTTSNDLDTLEEQKDDPKRRRIGRDFESAQWTEKVTPARLNSPDNEQVRMNFRTFPQIKGAIKKACKQSGEIQNEWIVRAALDRLRIDHPEIYKELESQKNEFPKVRHDAKHGVDFLIK